MQFTNKLVIDKFKMVNKRDPNKTRNLAQEMALDKMLLTVTIFSHQLLLVITFFGMHSQTKLIKKRCHCHFQQYY